MSEGTWRFGPAAVALLHTLDVIVVKVRAMSLEISLEREQEMDLQIHELYLNSWKTI